MDKILQNLTEEQETEVIKRLYARGGDIRQALLEEAQNVLEDIDLEEIADGVFFSLDLLQVETLWDSSGPTRDGYVDPGELAYELIEEELKSFIDQIWNYLQQGMEHEAKICCMGVLLGIYRYDQESTSEFKNWAVDIPNNCFERLLDDWQKKCPTKSLQTEVVDFARENCPGW
jgi:hypothetical protein